jgi:hypothetical protein
VSLPRPVGAIGSTFDDPSGAAPFYSRASFFQRAPSVNPQDAMRDLSFHFLKIRFRRVLVSGSDRTPPTNLPRSDWTDAHWVQILPAANRWRCQYYEIAPDGKTIQWKDLAWLRTDDHLPFFWSRSARAFQHADSADGPRRTFFPLTTAQNPHTNELTDSLPPKFHFALYAMVSRIVADAFGRSDQEAFDSIIPLNGLGAAIEPPSGTCVLHLIEIQFRTEGTFKTLDDLAKALFPSRDEQSIGAIDNTEDARARIVRISPAIPIVR